MLDELYLQNAGNAAKRFFIDGRYAIYALLAVIFMREFLYEKRMYGMAPDSFNKLNVTYSKKFICERPHMKKHFLNLSSEWPITRHQRRLRAVSDEDGVRAPLGELCRNLRVEARSNKRDKLGGKGVH